MRDMWKNVLISVCFLGAVAFAGGAVSIGGATSNIGAAYLGTLCWAPSVACPLTGGFGNGQLGFYESGGALNLYAAGGVRLQASNSTGNVVINTLTIPANGSNISPSTGGFSARNATAYLGIGTAGNEFWTLDAATAKATVAFASWVDQPTAVTIPSDGAGTPAAYTTTNAELDPVVTIDCQDANGCNLTLGETSMTSGQKTCFEVISTNVVNFADTAGVSELTGAFAAGQYDTICVKYMSDRFVEISRSNN